MNAEMSIYIILLGKNQSVFKIPDTIAMLSLFPVKWFLNDIRVCHVLWNCQVIFICFVIRIHKSYPFPSCHRKTDIPCRTYTLVVLMYNQNPVVFLCIAVTYSGAAICTAIIHENDFYVSLFLPLYALNAFGKVIFCIVYRDYNTALWVHNRFYLGIGTFLLLIL